MLNVIGIQFFAIHELINTLDGNLSLYLTEKMYKLKMLFIEIGKLMKIHKSKACKIKHKKFTIQSKIS